MMSQLKLAPEALPSSSAVVDDGELLLHSEKIKENVKQRTKAEAL